MANLQIPDSGTLLTREEMVSYMDAKVKQILDAISKVSKPEPLKKCDKGPTIKIATKVDDKKISVLFDARNVFKMIASVQLESSGNEVQLSDIISSETGKSLLINKENTSHFAPDNNTPVLVFNSKLKPSPTKYNIIFKATECDGESSYTFFFDDVVVPPPEPEKTCKPLTGKIVRVELTQK